MTMSREEWLVKDVIERARRTHPDGKMSEETANFCALLLLEECCDVPPGVVEGLRAKCDAASANKWLKKAVAKQNEAKAVAKSAADKRAAVAKARQDKLTAERLKAQVNAASAEAERLRVAAERAEARKREPSLEKLNWLRAQDGKPPYLF